MSVRGLQFVVVAALLAGGIGCPSEDTDSGTCGNDVVEGSEACDDGNTAAGDGCDPACAWEPCSDEDGDGHDDATCGGDDCDDAEALAFPGNAEVCDGIDNDCQDGADDGLSFLDYWPDTDGDGHGDAAATPVNACTPVADFVTNGDDCNDDEPLILPGATEIDCDGVDNDCDPATPDDVDLDQDQVGACTDCSDTDPDNWASCATCLDEDGDGAYAGCDAYTMRPGEDCEPLNPDVRPGVPEVCDNIDNDCVGGIDDNVAYLDYYTDADGDGFGDPASTPVNDCIAPGGSVADDTDCDDTDPDNWASCSTCVDGDGDGTWTGCDAYQILTEDCDDGDGDNFPGNAEICDGFDNDCTDGPENGLTFEDYWPDGDSDGYGDPNSMSVSACTAPAGAVSNDGDCDDILPGVNPGAPEICEDTIDNDCFGGDAVCACGNGAIESGESCDDGNLCAYDGCSDNPAGAPDQCQGEETVILTSLALGTGSTGFDLDGDGSVDNRLGGNVTLRGEFNTILGDTLTDGSLAQVFTIADLDNVPYSGTGTPGYQDDPSIVFSLYPTVDPACPSSPVYDGANPPPWNVGPWPVDVYSDSDAWDTLACTGGAQVTDADDPANGIYPTGGGQLANPAPAAPYLQIHAAQLSLALVGVQTALHNAHVEATVVDDTVGIDSLVDGVLGGAVAARDLWGIPLDGPGGNCATALHAVLAVAGVPDIDVDGGGIESLSVSCSGFLCFIPCGGMTTIGACEDEDGTVIPDSDIDGDGTTRDGECLLDPRMADGYSAGMTFTANKVDVVQQVSGSTYCP